MYGIGFVITDNDTSSEIQSKIEDFLDHFETVQYRICDLDPESEDETVVYEQQEFTEDPGKPISFWFIIHPDTSSAVLAVIDGTSDEDYLPGQCAYLRLSSAYSEYNNNQLKNRLIGWMRAHGLPLAMAADKESPVAAQIIQEFKLPKDL